MNAGYDSEEDNVPAIDTDGALNFNKDHLNVHQQQFGDNGQKDENNGHEYEDLGAI
jgi:hypothetical protein